MTTYVAVHREPTGDLTCEIVQAQSLPIAWAMSAHHEHVVSVTEARYSDDDLADYLDRGGDPRWLTWTDGRWWLMPPPESDGPDLPIPVADGVMPIQSY